MGSTGTGKSSVSRMFTYRNMLAHSVPLQFIRLMSGDTSVDVGDSLESETRLSAFSIKPAVAMSCSSIHQASTTLAQESQTLIY